MTTTPVPLEAPKVPSLEELLDTTFAEVREPPSES